MSNRIVCLNCGGTGFGDKDLLNQYGGVYLGCHYCKGLGYILKENKQMTTIIQKYCKVYEGNVGKFMNLTTYPEAISQSKSAIESHPEEVYYIFKIIAIVKRQKPVDNPIIVQEIE